MTSTMLRETFATFFVGDVYLGLPANEVREVMKDLSVTPIPLVSPALRGVFNARGDIVTVIDLGHRLGLGPSGAAARTHVLIDTPDGTVSLLVDAEGDVLDVDRAMFEPPPGGLPMPVRNVVMGAYKLPGRLLMVLDGRRLLQLDEDVEDDVNKNGVESGLEQ